MILTRAPCGIAGACGTRTMRQSAWASPATSEESCRGQGPHDANAVLAPFRHRTHVVFPLGVGLQRLS